MSKEALHERLTKWVDPKEIKSLENIRKAQEELLKVTPERLTVLEQKIDKISRLHEQKKSHLELMLTSLKDLKEEYMDVFSRINNVKVRLRNEYPVEFNEIAAQYKSNVPDDDDSV